MYDAKGGAEVCAGQGLVMPVQHQESTGQGVQAGEGEIWRAPAAHFCRPQAAPCLTSFQGGLPGVSFCLCRIETSRCKARMLGLKAQSKAMRCEVPSVPRSGQLHEASPPKRGPRSLSPSRSLQLLALPSYTYPLPLQLSFV